MAMPAANPSPAPAREAPAVVEMAGVRFTWPGKRAFSLAVSEFRLAPRERVLLLGPSGSGKSTLLSLLAGVVTAEHGRVAVLGQDLGALGSAARDRFRAEHMGIIFQMFNLLPYGSVLDNVLLPLRFSSLRRGRAAEARSAEAEARRLMRSLGLDVDIEALSAQSLSVGQQQRVAAARALIGRPELIIADEPTSALDRDRQAAFLDLLFGELDAAGSALIMVSHDETLAGRFDRLVRLDDIASVSRAGNSQGSAP